MGQRVKKMPDCMAVCAINYFAAAPSLDVGESVVDSETLYLDVSSGVKGLDINAGSILKAAEIDGTDVVGRGARRVILENVLARAVVNIFHRVENRSPRRDFNVSETKSTIRDLNIHAARICRPRGNGIFLLTIWFLCTATTFCVRPARGEEPNRRNGLEHFDQWIGIVRKSMNDNPDAVQEYLSYGLARDVGDDPRVLNLCEEVITKSTNPLSVVNAVGAVSVIEGWHVPIYAVSRRKRIATVLAEAMKHPEWHIKLAASRILDDMGGGYRKSAQDFYLSVLRDPPDEKTFRVMDRPFPGSTKALLVEVIKRLLRHWKASDADLVREATKKYQLLDFWEGEVKKIDRVPWRQTEEKFIADWRSAIEEK